MTLALLPREPDQPAVRQGCGAVGDDVAAAEERAAGAVWQLASNGAIRTPIATTSRRRCAGRADSGVD